MLAAGDTLFVVDDGGRIVGTAGLHATRVNGVASLGMSIVPAIRGQGWGRALLQAAIDHARGTQMHKIELEVWPDNERAIALYERFGFEVEGVRRDHYRRRDGSLRSAQLMALLLRSVALAGRRHVAPVERARDVGRALDDPEAPLPRAHACSRSRFELAERRARRP